jgi:hypothetical protein
MKTYFGNHLGICINNVDPENRGRVQIFVPHIMPALYEGWNELGEDIKLECVGNNLPNGLSSKVIEKLTQILPWAEAAMPVIGNSVAGTYNPETGNFNQTNTPEAAATTLDLNTAAGAFALNGDPNAPGVIANNVKLTYYSPTQETNDSGTLAGLGNSNNKLQPGIVALSPNLQQQYGLKNGDVVSLTLNNGVKHFGYVGDTTSSRLTDRFDVYLPGGSDKQLASTPGSGSLGSLRLEAAAPRRLTGKELDTQGPALLAQVAGRSGQTGINLNNPATAPDPSAAGATRPPFSQPEPTSYLDAQPNQSAVTQVNAPTPVTVGGKGNLQAALAAASANTPVEFVTGRSPGKCAKATRALANATLGVGNHFGPIGPIGGSAKDTIGKNYWEKEYTYKNPQTGEVKTGSLYERISTNNYVPQEGDIGITTGGTHGHAKIVVAGGFRSDRIDDGKAGLDGSSTAAVYRLTPLGQELYARTGLGDATALGKPAPDIPNTGSDGTGIASDDVSSSVVKNTTETAAVPLDTTGMAQGMFAIPGPGAMLWVFFREGDPMFPVYFAASYGAAEWQSAYKASSLPAYGPQENSSTAISNQTVFRPNNAGAITFTGAVDTEKDSRAVRMAHANGGYVELHPYGTVHYSPNEHLEQVAGTSYKYCLNREEWTQGDDNRVTIGNQWVVIGNPSQSNIETIEKLTEKVKQINAEMMKN